jgi:hypothetical protein
MAIPSGPYKVINSFLTNGRKFLIVGCGMKLSLFVFFFALLALVFALLKPRIYYQKIIYEIMLL